MDSVPENYTLYLLRHGESVGNAGGYYQGQTDFELTQTGRAQAEALAMRWLAEGLTFNKVISSPLQRALQTAEIIAERLSLAIELDADWMEMNNGVLGGLKHEDAAARFPQPAFRNPYEQIGQTGESEWDLYLRAAGAVRHLLRRPPGQYLVVSHGGILNMALRAMLGIPVPANSTGTFFRFGNSGFAVLEYLPARHRWHVERLNDLAHWPAEQID